MELCADTDNVHFSLYFSYLMSLSLIFCDSYSLLLNIRLLN